jgi:anti-sigma B factor antagonist
MLCIRVYVRKRSFFDRVDFLMEYQECLWEGIYFLRPVGNLTLYNSGDLERALLRQMESGIRFFIVDLHDVSYSDSSGMQHMAASFGRIRARAGRIIWVAPSRNVREILVLTRLIKVFEISNSVNEALSSLLDRPITNTPSLTFTPVVLPAPILPQVGPPTGGDTAPDQQQTSAVAQAPRKPDVEVFKAERVPRSTAVLGASGAAVFVFLATIGALVWASKQISSISVLTLILAVAIIFEVNLAVFILVATGSLSEKTTQRIMQTTLGKVPGLRVWIPRIGKRVS